MHNDLVDVSLPFYLPNLEHLTLVIDSDATFVWPGSAPPGLAGLSFLRITVACQEHLGPILSAATSVRTLKWTWRHDLHGPGEYENGTSMNVERIGAALSHVNHSVVDLAIKASYYYEDSDFQALRLIKWSSTGPAYLAELDEAGVMSGVCSGTRNRRVRASEDDPAVGARCHAARRVP